MNYSKRDKGLFEKNILLTMTARISTLLMSVIIVYPIIFILFVSLKDNKEFYRNIFGLPKIARWSNYSYSWIQGRIGMYALNSLTVTLSSLLIILVFSILAGYALAKLRIPKSELIITLLIGFNFIPLISISLPMYLQLIRMGFGRTLYILIFPYAAWHLPFSIYIFKKFFSTIPTDILESARIDGSGELRTFCQLIVPLVTPAIATVIVFNFILIWGEFLWGSIATSTATKIRTIPVGMLYFKGEYGIEWGPFAAAIVIVIIPLFAVFIYCQKFFIQGLSAGAIKG